MERALIDTSYFIAVEQGRPIDLSVLPDECAISVVTLGELRQGVLASNDLDERDVRMQTFSSVAGFEPLPIDLVVAATWSALKVKLRTANLRLGANDAWIAATAMAHQVPLITQDRGFVGTPGLEVVLA